MPALNPLGASWNTNTNTNTSWLVVFCANRPGLNPLRTSWTLDRQRGPESGSVRERGPELQNVVKLLGYIRVEKSLKAGNQAL